MNERPDRATIVLFNEEITPELESFAVNAIADKERKRQMEWKKKQKKLASP